MVIWSRVPHCTAPTLVICVKAAGEHRKTAKHLYRDEVDEQRRDKHNCESRRVKEKKYLQRRRRVEREKISENGEGGKKQSRANLYSGRWSATIGFVAVTRLLPRDLPSTLLLVCTCRKMSARQPNPFF